MKMVIFEMVPRIDLFNEKSHAHPSRQMCKNVVNKFINKYFMPVMYSIRLKPYS